MLLILIHLFCALESSSVFDIGATRCPEVTGPTCCACTLHPGDKETPVNLFKVLTVEQSLISRNSMGFLDYCHFLMFSNSLAALEIVLNGTRKGSPQFSSESQSNYAKVFGLLLNARSNSPEPAFVF